MNITNLVDPELWRKLLSNDFNRGYLVGAGLVIALLIGLLIIKIFIKIVFRTRRCRQISVHRADGDLVISCHAVENAVRQVLATFPQFSIRRIQLYCRGENYSITLFTTFKPNEAVGLPELSSQLKPKVTETLRQTFGIERLKKIRIQVEELGKCNLATQLPEVAETAENQPIAE